MAKGSEFVVVSGVELDVGSVVAFESGGLSGTLFGAGSWHDTEEGAMLSGSGVTKGPGVAAVTVTGHTERP